ncbi:unnamed protein product [Rotaria socialis]|uniref:Uncharacterized protein n=2 Tax=Rotaria socialis TaxID=392032 RepID=A0A818S781_9BILA|nr:unnamed protein product [Rotaria socialis]
MNKRTSSKIYWTCKTKNFTAKAQTDPSNNLLGLNEEHKDLIQPGHTEIQSFRKILENRVMNETMSITKIYDKEIAKAQFSSEILASVPIIYDIYSGLNQARRKLALALTFPSFDIPITCQITLTGEKILISDILVCRKKDC